MASTNWNDGNLITLTPGDTATCTNLNSGQLYGLIFYNSASADTSTTVSVVWSNSQPPAIVQIPGTTGNEGLGSVLFVNGSDTTTISAAVLQNNPGAKVQCYIASVKMPTNTAGINNQQLPSDGHAHSFNKFTRYYSVIASHWYQAQLQSNINQFTVIQFSEQSATVNVVNKVVDPTILIQAVGMAVNQYKVIQSDYQTVAWSLQGNGQQMVFVNTSSAQDAASATISLQSLSSLYK